MGDNVAVSLTFAMEQYVRDDLQHGPIKFRVLLVATGESVAPNVVSLSDVVFASPEMTQQPNVSFSDPAATIDVSLGDTPLVGGEVYLWVLDGYTVRNGIDGEAEIGTRNNWPGGDFYFGGYLSAPGVPLSSITVTPFGQPIDLAFTMTFSAVPESSTWAMMLLGFAGLGYAGYRVSRRTATVGLRS